MKRRGRRVAGARRAVAAVCLTALCASAQEREARVTVDCPVLDAEHRAALEARARSDLIVRHETGTLAFRCQGSTGIVAWTPSSEQTFGGQVSMPPDADAAIDALLEHAESLVAAHRAEPPAPVPPAEPTEAPVQAVAPVPLPPPEPPAEPAVEPSTPPPGKGSRGIPLGFAAGAAVEVWDWVPAIGGGVLMGAYVAPKLRIDAGGTVLFTTQDNVGVGGRLVRVSAGGELALGGGGRWRVGARVLFDTLKATAEAATGARTAQDSSLGGRLHGHYAAPLAGGLSVAFGPFVSLRGSPVRVELGDTEAFRIPVITGGAEILLDWDAR